MNLSEIKQAIADGKNVYWSSLLYKVLYTGGEYVIKCTSNNHMIGLTWADNITLNGNEEDFFIA